MLGQGVEVEPGHQSGVDDCLEVHVPVSRSALQLDHDEASGRVQPQNVQPVARRHSVRVGPPVVLLSDHEHRLPAHLRVGDHPFLKVLSLKKAFRSQPGARYRRCRRRR